jgi:predicted CXXCH cytochrome family protein
MRLAYACKWVVVCGFALCGLLLASSGSLSAVTEAKAPVAEALAASPDDYVGSDTCKACHEDTFNSFTHTAHAKLAAHVEGSGDKSKIITFEGWTSKQISETCLECHAGREEHNNFRRGEHWRNDVGCTDCHSAHPPKADPTVAGSIALVSPATAHKPESSTLRQLVQSEPELCLKCHNEMRGQFQMPFHHKVLEGTMRCSDCHNPHGGFEQKQTRLAVGADAPCIKCHTDKQGPFVYEHAPVKLEGCAICHSPHGSPNPKMLLRAEVRQTCLECHSNAHEIGAPNTPSFHNQAQARWQNCTTCHVRIHGSMNSPTFFH